MFAMGLKELCALAFFFVGYFTSVHWLMLIGGIILVLDDIYEMYIGILNPLFPIVFAVFLSVLLDPWYVGVLWASAGFKILNVPVDLRRIFSPRTVALEVMEKAGDLNTHCDALIFKSENPKYRDE
jgi:hypothetical protein